MTAGTMVGLLGYGQTYQGRITTHSVG